MFHGCNLVAKNSKNATKITKLNEQELNITNNNHINTNSNDDNNINIETNMINNNNIQHTSYSQRPKKIKQEIDVLDQEIIELRKQVQSMLKRK